jgi:hypothetical protein
MGIDSLRLDGRVALATGVVGLCSVASLTALFVVGQPFGTVNDFSNATLGVLSGVLAATTLSRRKPSLPESAAVGAAIAGAAIAVAGSALVISGTTTFFLAGNVSSVGFGLIGAWLVAVNRASGAERWSRRARALGIVAGATMLFGFVMVPAVLLRLDDMSAAPAWVWIGFVGWIGTFILYPLWSLWVGRLALAGATTASIAEPASATR